MWQRIQTLYLGISTALIFSMFFCTFATIIGPQGEELTIGYHEKLPYLTMLIMLFTAHVAATASFKAFFLQARVAMIASLMAIGFQIWLAVDVIRFHGDMTFSFTTIFPFAAAILDGMAAKRSLVDEMTITAVKSVKGSRRSKRRKS
jgi:hypothetical protein